MTRDTIGLEISTDHLGAWRMSDGARRRFTNEGYRPFRQRLCGAQDADIVYESTGLYHHASERRMAEAGMALVKVNPRKARRLAEATGRLAKTDRLDATMLARMSALLDVPVRPVASTLITSSMTCNTRLRDRRKWAQSRP